VSRKIVVIGSNSFSGSDFIDLLLEAPDREVVGISRSPEKREVFLPYKRRQASKFSFYQYDLNKDIGEIIRLLESFQPEYVVNFAAQSEVAPSWETPWDWFETNVVALSRLGHYLNRVKYLKRYLHISSPEVYGTCEGLVKEDAPLNPSTPYAVSKAAADLFLFALVKNFQFPLSMVRATNVYGAHQQLFKIIPRSVIAIKKGQKIFLHGGGKAVKSYIHIRDVSRGELAVMERGRPGEIYHLSPERGMAVREVVGMICEMMRVGFERATENVSERLGQDRAYVIDSSKVRQDLHWQPHVSMREGLAQVITWVEENWPVIADLPQEYRHQP
jgi:dTDP-glucose 4,6-dehydratase